MVALVMLDKTGAAVHKDEVSDSNQRTLLLIIQKYEHE